MSERTVLTLLPWLLLAGVWAVVIIRERRLRTNGALQRINPPALGEPRGWTNGMYGSGNVLFVAGQTARDGSGRIAAGGMREQWDQALRNVLTVVEAAGGRPHDIARMTVYVTDVAAYRTATREIGTVWKEQMGRHYPAMTLVEVKGLVDEGAMVEIEATAVIS